MLGGSGLTHSTKLALLNANYVASRLKDYYNIKFKNDKGLCAHEFLIDLAEFEKSADLKVMDFAKRLQVGLVAIDGSPPMILPVLKRVISIRTSLCTPRPARGQCRPRC